MRFETMARGLFGILGFSLALVGGAPCLADCPPSSGFPTLLVQPSGFYYEPVLLNGPTILSHDIVVLGDGFTADDQALFETKLDKLVDYLTGGSSNVYSAFADYQCSLNIWKFNVVSNESGIDIPLDDLCKDTALDCTRGNPDGFERCITSISPLKILQVADLAPDYDTVLVLTNEPTVGGCAGSTIVYSYVDTTLHAPFARTAVHELAHQIGGLADEYCCGVFCDPALCDPGEEAYPADAPEPLAPNVTVARDLGLLPWSGAPTVPTAPGVLDAIKWGDLIDPWTELPTSDGSLPAGTVGLWEGAAYHVYGIFRPEKVCAMRKQIAPTPFCQVCTRVLEQKLAPKCCPEGLPIRLCSHAFLPWFKNLRRMDPTADILRIPFPPCLECPDDQLLDTIELILDATGTNGLSVVIVDEDGEVLFEGTQDADAPLEASFLAQRGTQYFALLSPGTETSELLEIETTLIRNGELVEPTDLEVEMEF